MLSRKYIEYNKNSISFEFGKILIYAFLLITTLYYIFGTKTNLLFLRFSQVIGFSLFILFCTNLYRKKNNVIFFKFSSCNLIFIITLLSLLLCKIANANISTLDIVYPMLYFGVISALMKLKLKYKYFLCLYLFVHCFLLYKYFTEPNPDLWIRGSSNQVSPLLLSVTLLLYIEKYIRKLNISIYPALFTFILCLFAQGTSGILTSFILFICLLYSKANSNYIKKFMIYSFIAIIIYIMFRNIGFITFFLREFIKTYITLMDGTEPRLGVILYYIKTSGFYELLFGNKLALTKYQLMFNLTSHNSFLSIHSVLGIGTFILLLLFIKVIYNLVKSRNNFILLLLFVLTLRSLTDDLLFQGHILFSIPFFYILFLTLSKKFNNY